MVCLGFEPADARWKELTIPLNYGGHSFTLAFLLSENVNVFARLQRHRYF